MGFFKLFRLFFYRYSSPTDFKIFLYLYYCKSAPAAVRRKQYNFTIRQALKELYMNGGCRKSRLADVFTFVFLCEVLCDPLFLSILQLNTKDTKVCTKVHKGLFQQPQLQINLISLLKSVCLY